jgi:hypothetical protein
MGGKKPPILLFMVLENSMSKEMKLIMESWRSNLITETKALQIHEQLISEFVDDIKTLTENKAEINEILSKVSEFAKKAYQTYSDLKKGTIEKVLTKAIDGALKIIPLIKDKVPNVASKIERILNELKKSENMTIAVSVVSIIVGLMTGQAFDALLEVLDVISEAPNLIKAYQAIQQITDTADITKAVDKTGQLINVAQAAE